MRISFIIAAGFALLLAGIFYQPSCQSEPTFVGGILIYGCARPAVTLAVPDLASLPMP